MKPALAGIGLLIVVLVGLFWWRESKLNLPEKPAWLQVWEQRRDKGSSTRWHEEPIPVERPDGMVPAAFADYLNACKASGINPMSMKLTAQKAYLWEPDPKRPGKLKPTLGTLPAGVYRRIGQTIGNHPRSAGYHLADGTYTLKGKKYPYCAAVDLGVNDLNRKQINRFLTNLARHHFAAWYREGPKWKYGEHIHAIYTRVAMKAQLRRQVRQFRRRHRLG